MARLVDLLSVLRNLVVWVEVGMGVEGQRCQPIFGLVSRVLEPDSPLGWCGIAGKDPQQIESAARVAYGGTAS